MTTTILSFSPFTLILTLAMFAAACGGKSAPQETKAPVASDAASVSDVPEQAATTASAADTAKVAAPATTWSLAAVPTEVTRASPALTVLDAVLADGLAGQTDARRGVAWLAAGDAETTWRTGAELDAVAPAFVAFLKDARASARCQGTLCLLAAGEARWLVKLRRKGLTTLFISGLYELGSHPLIPRYVDWINELREAWRKPGDNDIGAALSFEESEEHDNALKALANAIERDPGNPWPLYYRARMRALTKDYKDAFIDLKRVSTHDDPAAVSALLLGSTDKALQRLRAHTAVDAIFAEMHMSPPLDPETFAHYLCRFRGAPRRLRLAVGRTAEDAGEDAAGPPDWETLSAFLEAACFHPVTVEDTDQVVWHDPRGTKLVATLMRTPDGALRLVSINPGTLPEASP